MLTGLCPAYVSVASARQSPRFENAMTRHEDCKLKRVLTLMQETAMVSKKLAAAAIGLCLTWGSAYAGPETVQDPRAPAASPADVPEGVGATNDVIVLEL